MGCAKMWDNYEYLLKAVPFLCLNGSEIRKWFSFVNTRYPFIIWLNGKRNIICIKESDEPVRRYAGFKEQLQESKNLIVCLNS